MECSRILGKYNLRTGKDGAHGHRISHTEGRLLRFSYDFPMSLAQP